MSQFPPPRFYASYYGLPSRIHAPMGKSIAAAKQALGDGITRMWQAYFQSDPGPRKLYVHPDEAFKVLRICDYLAAVSGFLPEKSRRGVLSGHGLGEVRSLVLDFAGAPETEREMNFLYGYRMDMNYSGPCPKKRAVFPDPAKVWADFNEKMDHIAAAHRLERVRLGEMEILLDHGKTELAIARWDRPKFGTGFHCNVAARVVTRGPDPSLLAKEVMETLDIMPYNFVSTMEHALF